jgi:hypothetical protein
LLKLAIGKWSKWLDSKTEQLRARTKEFAIRIVHLFRSLPPAKEAQVIGNQLSKMWNISWRKLSRCMPGPIQG